MLPTLALAKLIKTTWRTTKSCVISKNICRHLMKWLVFCPHPFFQICLLLKITTWTWISHQCQSRSCRLWANLQNLSRIWLTAACWSYTWKSGMTQPSTRLWFNCTVGHKSLAYVWRVSLSFLVRIIDVLFFYTESDFLVLVTVKVFKHMLYCEYGGLEFAWAMTSEWSRLECLYQLARPS